MQIKEEIVHWKFRATKQKQSAHTPPSHRRHRDLQGTSSAVAPEPPWGVVPALLSLALPTVTSPLWPLYLLFLLPEIQHHQENNPNQTRPHQLLTVTFVCKVFSARPPRAPVREPSPSTHSGDGWFLSASHWNGGPTRIKMFDLLCFCSVTYLQVLRT